MKCGEKIDGSHLLLSLEQERWPSGRFRVLPRARWLAVDEWSEWRKRVFCLEMHSNVRRGRTSVGDCYSLPLPVWDFTITSWPVRINGMAFSWTLVKQLIWNFCFKHEIYRDRDMESSQTDGAAKNDSRTMWGCTMVVSIEDLVPKISSFAVSISFLKWHGSPFSSLSWRATWKHILIDLRYRWIVGKQWRFLRRCHLFALT